ncbi:MAG: Os1348 family NHLP clan protein [Reyranellales bacterium]
MPSRKLVELISRVLLDSELREKLFADPDAFARVFDLGPDETQMVKRLDRRSFEQRVAALRSG